MHSSIFSSKAGFGSKGFFWSFMAASILLGSVFLIGSEILIRTKVEPNHNYYKYLNLFRTSKSADVVFGDSQAAYGVTGYDRFTNLAYGGDNIHDVAAKIRVYFAQRKPNRVIIEAGLHHFSKGYLIRNLSDPNFFRLLKEFDKYTLRLLVGPSRKELFNYWKMFLGGRTFVSRQPFLADGSRPKKTAYKYSGLPEEQVRIGARRFALKMEPAANIKDSSTAAIYDSIISFLLKRGARVCLVTFPVSDIFKSEAEPMKGYANVQDFFARLAKDNGINYVNGFQMHLPNKMFDDNFHLNYDGAVRFTADVRDRCFADTAS